MLFLRSVILYTNVIERPAACAITSISLDHREMLGDTLPVIAGEKAGIMKPDVPVAIGAQPAEVAAVLLAEAARRGAQVRLRDRDWHLVPGADGFRYKDGGDTLELPPPSLPGAFQLDNAGIAIATLRASGLVIPDAAIAAGICRGGMAGAAATAGWTVGGFVAARVGTVARWRAQSRRGGGAGRAFAGLGRSAGACARRYEAVEGFGGIPASAAASGDDAMGGGGGTPA